MQVRCQRCSFMFTISRDALAEAAEEIEKSATKHHNFECPKCRRLVKVPARDIRRAVPRQEQEKEE